MTLPASFASTMAESENRPVEILNDSGRTKTAPGVAGCLSAGDHERLFNHCLGKPSASLTPSRNADWR
jgi:hypothetical protein